jgi:hypothetical protein
MHTTTWQKCYQAADEETMEAVVLQPRRPGRKAAGYGPTLVH